MCKAYGNRQASNTFLTLRELISKRYSGTPIFLLGLPASCPRLGGLLRTQEAI